MKRRVCIMQTNLPSERIKSGGEERFTVGLAKELSDRYEIFVLTKGPEDRTVRKGDITIRYISCTGIRFLRFFVYVLLLAREAMRIKDLYVIQANISDGANGLAGVLASKLMGVPCISRVSRIGPLPELGLARRLMLKFIFKRSEVVVSINSNLMAERIRKIWGKSRIVVKPHGISMSGLSKPKKHRKGRKKLLFVGRLVRFKNVEMLVKVMHLLKERGDVKLAVIGTGPEERRLKELAKLYEVTDVIDFKGELRNEAVMRHMESSDVFLFPSKDEPRGIVIIEAMLKGMPVVSVDRGGPKDIIREGRNGFLTGPYDAEDMAKRVSRLLDDGKLFERISRNNVEDVKKYSWEKVGVGFEDTYALARFTWGKREKARAVRKVKKLKGSSGE